MDIHNVHGTEVGFHGDAKEAHDFLNTGVHSHVAQGYFSHAKEHGEAHFFDDKGNRFKIEHKMGEDGKDTYSVSRSHHI